MKPFKQYLKEYRMETDNIPPNDDQDSKQFKMPKIEADYGKDGNNWGIFLNYFIDDKKVTWDTSLGPIGEGPGNAPLRFSDMPGATIYGPTSLGIYKVIVKLANDKGTPLDHSVCIFFIPCKQARMAKMDGQKVATWFNEQIYNHNKGDFNMVEDNNFIKNLNSLLLAKQEYGE